LFLDDREFRAEFLIEFSQEGSGYRDVSVDIFTIVGASDTESFGDLVVIIGQ